MVEQPFVSVVLATFNRKEQLKECLDSLLKQSYPKEKYEIIAVDDGSKDGTRDVLADYEQKNSGLIKFFAQKNAGAAAARNLGIENSKGDIVCLTDDDCIADEKWIITLISHYAEGVGGVGGRIVAYKPETNVERYADLYNQEQVSRTSLMTGNASYKRDILRKIGGFDIKLLALEDIDLGIRVRREGFALKYAPEAVIYHRNYRTVGTLIKKKYAEGLAFVCLSKKYVKHFSVSFHLAKWDLKIFSKLILFPIGVVYAKKKKDYAFSQFFNIIVLCSQVLGITVGAFTVDYTGHKVVERMDFMDEESISGLMKKVLLRKV